MPGKRAPSLDEATKPATRLLRACANTLDREDCPLEDIEDVIKNIQRASEVLILAVHTERIKRRRGLV